MELIDIIVEKAKREKQRVLLTESDGNANIHWDTRSLDDAETLLECGLEYVKKLKATTPYKDANKEYWRGHREGKQGEKKEATCVAEIIDHLTEKEQEILFKELEMQKVQKPTIQPKFKVGDWIKFKELDIFLYVIDIENDRYKVELFDGTRRYYHIEYIDKICNLWTIEDAKDGDVLVYGDNPAGHHLRIIMLFETMRTLSTAFNHFHIFDDEFRVNSWCDCGVNAHPATKEQRDLLFAKMHEAGYEWDAEDNVLKEIEQKTTNKVEPKFHKGDWIYRCCGKIYHILEIVDKKYYVEDLNGEREYIYVANSNIYRLWSIEDAKDGDVLVSYENQPFIFKGLLDICHPGMPTAYCGLSTIGRFHVSTSNSYWTDLYGVKPATKEQRDTLMNAMSDAGYTFDFERKELKAVVDEEQIKKNLQDNSFRRMFEQKPAWSEEDERIHQCLIRDQEKALDDVRNDKYGHSEIISDLKEMYRERINWLESIKERLKGE